MGITSFTTTEYTIKCDICHRQEVCHSFFEGVHNKRQAITWAGMHTSKGRILCDACYKKEKETNYGNTNVR